MESDYHWLLTIGLVTSSIIAVTANMFLLVVFFKGRGLCTVANRFVINLLITNLLSSILLIPLLLADQEINSVNNTTSFKTNETITEFQKVIIEEQIVRESFHLDNDILIETSKHIFTENVIFSNDTNQKFMCYFAQSGTSFVCTASIFSILLIGINQYFAVIHSLRYHVYINKCRSTIFIGSSWLLALFFAILSCLTYSDKSLWHFCRNHNQTSDTERIFNTIYAFSYFMVVILAPFVAICVIYICIYTAAHKNSERMRKSTSSANSNLDYIQVPIRKENKQSEDTLEVKDGRKMLPKVHSAPNFSHLMKQNSFNDILIKDKGDEPSSNRNKVTRTCSERSTNKFISTLKHKISNASVFRYREETRAAKISTVVIFMVLICYIPYGITLVLNCELINVDTNQIFHYLSLIVLIFSNIISPFLFGYRNKRVQREIGKIFGVVPNANQHHHLAVPERHKRQSVIVRNRSFEDFQETYEHNIINEPFLAGNCVVPEVIVTCKPENERKSILKRVCNTSNWPSYKKCNFIPVPDGCISGEARGSFSSASTQISSEE